VSDATSANVASAAAAGAREIDQPVLPMGISLRSAPHPVRAAPPYPITSLAHRPEVGKF
jgi:hypothetical protein